MNLANLDKDLQKIRDANPLSTLPNLNIMTTNTDLLRIQSCKNNAYFLGYDDNSNNIINCKNICGSDGKVIEIKDNFEYYTNEKKLTKGFWCIADDLKCNLNTGYVLATINGATCKSRFPRLFGGSDTSTIIACNNEFFQDNGSVLWDNLYNKSVNPFDIYLSNEDEKLSDGRYRFTCKYGRDNLKNKLIEHPLDRLQPMQNPCTRTLFNAHPDIKFTGTGCDCGNEDNTRVSYDKVHKTCSSCKIDPKKAFIHYCFTAQSPYKNVTLYQPCLPTRFVQSYVQCENIKLNINEIPEET